ncbi:MAG: helix-turn-helix domain-containing protein [Rikenellaceae bacterium]
MDISILTTKSWVAILDRIAAASERSVQLCEVMEDKGLWEWLDNNDVCEILQISKRTLQNYRDSGVLGYTKTDGKIYYRPRDIQTLINHHKIG